MRKVEGGEGEGGVEDVIDEGIVTSSGKMRCLDRILAFLRPLGTKFV